MRQYVNRRELLQCAAFVLVILMAIALLSSCSRGSKNSDAGSTESSSSASESISVQEVELSQTTEYLEYSPKDVDPTTLVSASDSGVSVTTGDTIDLLTVGTQVVEYELSSGDGSDTREIQFIVRDTKAPAIELSNSTAIIDQGEDFDPQSCISKVSDPVDGDLGFVDSEPEAHGEEAGLEQFYDEGWFIVDGALDADTPGHTL